MTLSGLTVAAGSKTITGNTISYIQNSNTAAKIYLINGIQLLGGGTVTVTKNEIFESWNQGGKYHLAIVLVGEDDSIDGPHYISHPFKEEPGWGVSSVNYDLKALLELSTKL